MNEFDGLVERLLSANIYLEQAIELVERGMIERALASTEGNQSEAAKLLGIHRNTLQKKLIIYGLRAPVPRKTAGRQGRLRKRKAGAA
jgi:DNA-binding NtrC family response regulator